MRTDVKCHTPEGHIGLRWSVSPYFQIAPPSSASPYILPYRIAISIADSLSLTAYFSRLPTYQASSLNDVELHATATWTCGSGRFKSWLAKAALLWKLHADNLVTKRLGYISGKPEHGFLQEICQPSSSTEASQEEAALAGPQRKTQSCQQITPPHRASSLTACSQISSKQKHSSRFNTDVSGEPH